MMYLRVCVQPKTEGRPDERLADESGSGERSTSSTSSGGQPGGGNVPNITGRIVLIVPIDEIEIEQVLAPLDQALSVVL
jgi:hypothetical protein